MSYSTVESSEISAAGSSAALLRQQLLQSLRSRILTGDLVAGAKLDVTELAAEYGTSVMPVREALRDLHQAGLVQISSRRFTRVAMPDPALADEIYPLILELERYAALTGGPVPVAAVRSARDLNESFRRAAAKRDVTGCIQADAAFHDVILRLAGNPTLDRVIADLKGRITLLESRYYQFDFAEKSTEQHDTIIDALARNDRQAAADAIAANWRHGWEGLRVVLSEQASPAPPADASITTQEARK